MIKSIKKINDINLKGKFIGALLAIIIVSVFVMLVTSIYWSKKAIEKQMLTSVTNIAKLKAENINDFYDRVKSNIEVISNSEEISAFTSEDKNNKFISREDVLVFLNNFKNHNKYFRVSLLDKNYSILISSDSYYERKTLSTSLIKVTRETENVFSNSNIYKIGDIYIISFFYALKNSYGEIIGYVNIDCDMNNIYEYIQNNNGLGESGETLLAMPDKEGALYLNPLRYDKSAALNKKAYYGDNNSISIIEACSGNFGNGIVKDYRNVDVISAWQPVHSFQWGLIAKIDVNEAFEPIHALRNQLIFISFLLGFLGLFIAIRFAIYITIPINKLKDAMIVIGNGNVLSRKLKKVANDEVGEMIDQANNLVDFQKNIIEFTQEIGKGNFDFESKNDISKGDLGRELLKMKTSLQKVNEDEKKRNWVTEGLAKFAGILRENNDDLNILSDNIIDNIVKYLGANQGGIFILNEDGKEPKMVLQSAYAYERKKFIEKEISLGEGLIGECWQEKERIFLTDIPNNYINIKSGFGSSNPTCILILPLMVNEDIYGIIEIASFTVFDDYQIEFLERLCNSIASTLSTVRANLHTSSLLEEAQQMSEEMQAQEEELRQNAEEMQATQEEMERAQNELIKKESVLRAIFDNMDDTIFAINTDYEITIINQKLKEKYEALKIDLSPGRNILEVLPEDKKQFWKERYDRALGGEEFETVDEVAPNVKAKVFHYPTYNDKGEIMGVAVVSRIIN